MEKLSTELCCLLTLKQLKIKWGIVIHPHLKFGGEGYNLYCFDYRRMSDELELPMVKQTLQVSRLSYKQRNVSRRLNQNVTPVFFFSFVTVKTIAIVAFSRPKGAVL